MLTRETCWEVGRRYCIWCDNCLFLFVQYSWTIVWWIAFKHNKSSVNHILFYIFIFLFIVIKCIFLYEHWIILFKWLSFHSLQVTDIFFTSLLHSLEMGFKKMELSINSSMFMNRFTNMCADSQKYSWIHIQNLYTNS